jgi:hypothetical protein
VLDRGPLQQAKERFQARKARPDREMVQDDVEAALTQEIAHLNAVTSQLSQKVRAGPCLPPDCFGACLSACLGACLWCLPWCPPWCPILFLPWCMAWCLTWV